MRIARSLALGGLAVASFASISLVRAQDEASGKPRLSWNPLEKAAAGDWASDSKHIEETREKRAVHPRSTHVRVRVAKVEGEELKKDFPAVVLPAELETIGK